MPLTLLKVRNTNMNGLDVYTVHFVDFITFVQQMHNMF